MNVVDSLIGVFTFPGKGRNENRLIRVSRNKPEPGELAILQNIIVQAFFLMQAALKTWLLVALR